MAIGNGANVTMGGLNAQLGNAAISTRDAMLNIIEVWAYVLSLGANEAAQVAGLQAAGFGATDAQAYWTAANEMYALSQIYYGQQNLPTAFNYDSALAGARGPS